MIFVVFLDPGGAVAIALSFRKVAKLPMPAVPINLSSCGGSKLFPRLFVALYEFSSTVFNSDAVMYYYYGSFSGLYLSIATLAL